jgi:hypothetical protein
LEILKMIRPNAIIKATEILNVAGSGVRWSDPSGEIYEILGDLTAEQITEIEATADTVLEEWTANEYARNRKAEYPQWEEQLNKIYDDGLEKWKTEMVDPVKAKYPKP